MSIDNNMLQQLLLLPAILIILTFAGMALAVGAGLIVASPKMFRFFSVANYYVSTRHGLKSLAMPHNVEQLVGRHRRLIGALIVVGAVYSLYALLLQIDYLAIEHSLQHILAPEPAAAIVAPLRWMLLIGNAIAILVGLLLMVFPASLRRMETLLNHWYSFRQVAPDMDRMNMTLDHWVERFPRTAGWIILAGALFGIGNFVILLLRMDG